MAYKAPGGSAPRFEPGGCASSGSCCPALEERCVLKDFAANSQALADSRRASKDLGDAIAAGAPVETLNELTAIQAAAQERVLLLRGRAG